MKMKFGQLTEEQKAKAIEHHREINFHGGWYDCEKADFHEKLEQHGFHDIQSNFTGFGCQGDGACFSANLYNLEGFLRHVGKWSEYRILHTLIKDRELGYKVSTSGRYCHEYTMSVDELNSYINDTPKQRAKIDELTEYLLEYCRDLARDYYKILSEQNDYLSSDESISETIKVNDMEFDIDPREPGVTYL